MNPVFMKNEKKVLFVTEGHMSPIEHSLPNVDIHLDDSAC